MEEWHYNDGQFFGWDGECVGCWSLESRIFHDDLALGLSKDLRHGLHQELSMRHEESHYHFLGRLGAPVTMSVLACFEYGGLWVLVMVHHLPFRDELGITE